jgi:hypothetical protein
MARRSTIVAALAALLALGLMVAAPVALAHHREDHDNGRASASDGGSDHDGDADNDPAVTSEDNDADGVSNAGDTNESHHPSGKDKFLENGKSGNQGKSESDPDDNVGPMRREEPPCDNDPRGADKCTDKPGGSGGHDTLDQDGNNGCGNDQDFDDDNNGWCGKPAVVEAPPPPPPCCEVPPEEGGNVPPPTIAPEVTEGPEVLGARIQKRQPGAVAMTRQARGGVLPFTGAGLAGFVVIALGMIASGGAILRMKRS